MGFGTPSTRVSADEVSRMGVLTPTLTIENLTVQLPAGADRERAVQDVGFEIRAGELLCLVGESGSGKSIVAHTVMGLLPRQVRPIGGRVLLEGEDLLQASRLRQLRDAALRCSACGLAWQTRENAWEECPYCGARQHLLCPCGLPLLNPAA